MIVTGDSQNMVVDLSGVSARQFDYVVHIFIDKRICPIYYNYYIIDTQYS